MSADKPDDTRSQEPDFAAMWSSDGATRSFSPSATATGLPIDLPFLFAPGQSFGPYLIVRPLGKGGMGQVYEAEETESGRRIAMKILSRGLGDDEERERFLREGQLAASLSHPNTVYVFGTNEVQGFPVIAMELAPGGTLKDLVVDGTPLTPAQAVDAILQVVAGLDAVAALGILHRDIKPSNCFVDREGRVLVGDFGLSMATQARDAATTEAAGTIMGTPGFASPEQLRGETLDVRSDIYSVGATLYYLLTGRAPFDDKSVVTLITRIATEAPPVVTSFRPDVPARLASLVAKCLAKTPGERYANYPALAAALEPFRSAALTPASLGRRFLAGFIDNFTSTLPMLPFNMIMGARLGEDFARQGVSLLVVLPSIISSLLYYTILEGRFGCGFGKAILNLRVVDETQAAPGFRRAFVRSAVFLVPPQMVSQTVGLLLLRYAAAAPAEITAGNVIASVAGFASLLTTLLVLASMFITARRANGFAGIHDRITRTRVVLRPQAIEARQSRQAMPAGSSIAPRSAGDARIGPYVVTPELKEQLPSVAAAVTVDAYDDRLQRGVWMELLPAGTPALPATRRDLGRPARARWLSGRRSEAECWDAYEAIDGRPLMQTIAQPQPWSRVRHWLADLGGEVAEGVKDGSLPPLHVDRVWIGTDDRARLLDWSPPSSTGLATADPRSPIPDPRSPASDLRSAQQFIYGVAAGALRGVHPDLARSQPPSTPLPVPARTVMLSLQAGTVPTADLLGSQVSEVLRTPAAFPRRRRLLQIVFCSVIPVVIAIAVLATIKLQIRSRTANPEAFTLKSCVQQLVTLDRKGKLTAKEQEQRDLIEIYIAERLHDPAEESASYARAFPAVSSLQRESLMAQQALVNHPQRSPEQIKKADEVVGRLLASTSSGLNALNPPLVLWALMAFVASGAAGLVAALAFIGALVTRSGFTLRAFGAALVTADGCPATRFHAVRRMIVTWSPLALAWLIFTFSAPIKATTVSLALLYTLPLAILAAGAFWAWRHPSRGIQDRIVGTWIVPR
jgi:eukaryotic-like serine/threonine-protein kinase